MDRVEPGCTRTSRCSGIASAGRSGRPDVTVEPRRIELSAADLRLPGLLRDGATDASTPERPRYVLEGTAPRWRDLEGFHTRFGDVRELLLQVDDRYVIMNAGDELALRFPEAPPPAPGLVRDFVVIGDGWEKDGDYNTTASRTVLPLPTHRSASYGTAPARLEDDPVYRRNPRGLRAVPYSVRVAGRGAGCASIGDHTEGREVTDLENGATKGTDALGSTRFDMRQYARPILAVLFVLMLATPAIVRRFSASSAAGARASAGVDARERYGFPLTESSKAAGLEFVHEAPTLDGKLGAHHAAGRLDGRGGLGRRRGRRRPSGSVRHQQP